MSRRSKVESRKSKAGSRQLRVDSTPRPPRSFDSLRSLRMTMVDSRRWPGSRKGAIGGRATSDNLGSIRLQGSLPFGPESVRGGNLGERIGEMGALKIEASCDRSSTGIWPPGGRGIDPGPRPLLSAPATVTVMGSGFRLRLLLRRDKRARARNDVLSTPSTLSTPGERGGGNQIQSPGVDS